MAKRGAKNHPMWYEPEEKKNLMEKALELISQGTTINKSAETVGVCPPTLRMWMLQDEWAELSARARMIGTHALADQCIEIADQIDGDYVKTDDGLKPNHDHINRAKLRIDTRMRLIGKWNRKDYGERVTNELTGEGGGPVKQEHFLDLSGLDQSVIAGLMQIGAIADED